MTVKTNTAAFTQERHSGSKAWEEGMCVIRSYCKWFLTKFLILPCIFEKMHKTDWAENLAVYRTWPLIHPPPSGSTANILVALLPLSFMLAATPDTRPPPPQHTITTSGFGISSNISTPALLNKENTHCKLFQQRFETSSNNNIYKRKNRWLGTSCILKWDVVHFWTNLTHWN